MQQKCAHRCWNFVAVSCSQPRWNKPLKCCTYPIIHTAPPPSAAPPPQLHSPSLKPTRFGRYSPDFTRCLLRLALRPLDSLLSSSHIHHSLYPTHPKFNWVVNKLGKSHEIWDERFHFNRVTGFFFKKGGENEPSHPPSSHCWPKAELSAGEFLLHAAWKLWCRNQINN